MNTSLKCAVLAYFSCLASFATAQTTASPTQWGMQTINGEDPYYIMPEGFANKDSAYNKGQMFYLQAWFKDGKDKSNWQEQLLLKALPRAIFPPGNNFEAIQGLSVESAQKNCQRKVFSSELEKIDSNKYGFYLICGILSSTPSIALVSYNVVVEGNNSIYSISRDAKIESFDEPPSDLTDRFQQWRSHLSRTTICPKGVMCIRQIGTK